MNRFLNGGEVMYLEEQKDFSEALKEWSHGSGFSGFTAAGSIVP